MTTDTITLAVALAAGLLLCATPAGAQLIENAPGAMCVSATAGADARVQSDGQASNPSDLRATFVCPAERPGQGGWTRELSAKVFVRDRHPDQDVCCRVVSQNPAGRQVRGDTVCSRGSSPDQQTLNLPELRDASTWSHFFVRCAVPPVGDGASGVLTYRIIQE